MSQRLHKTRLLTVRYARRELKQKSEGEGEDDTGTASGAASIFVAISRTSFFSEQANKKNKIRKMPSAKGRKLTGYFLDIGLLTQVLTCFFFLSWCTDSGLPLS